MITRNQKKFGAILDRRTGDASLKRKVLRETVRTLKAYLTADDVKVVFCGDGTYDVWVAGELLGISIYADEA